MTQLKHYDNLGTARFITFSCAHRWKLLTDSTVISIVLDEIDRGRMKHDLTLLAYVIMPNHVHLVIHPRDPVSIGSVIGEIKSRSAKRVFALWRAQNNALLNRLVHARPDDGHPSLWLPKCYDHNCRTVETIREKIVYCHNNPVKAGLAESPGEWKWSSFNWYYTGKSGPLVMDDFEM